MPSTQAVILFFSQKIKDQVLSDPRAVMVLGQLSRREYKSADFDKKRGTSEWVSTVKINSSDRLLMMVFMVEAKAYFCVIDVIYHHHYRHSPLNDAKCLKAMRECIEKKQLKDIPQYQFVDQESKHSDAASATQELELDEGILYNNQYIFLNDLQKQAIEAPLPLIISGAPGSGKTCVAFSIFHSIANSMMPGERSRVLYITSSPTLVKQMKRNWLHQDVAGLKVDFMTYEQLYLLHQAGSQKLEKLSRQDFYTWFKTDFLKRPVNRQIKKTAGKTALQLLLENPEHIYPEMRLASGYDKKDYIEVGNKHSLLKTQKERAMLYDIYQNYCNHLKHTQSYDLSFTDFELARNYDRVVVDEGQDFSLKQIKKLLELSSGRLCMCYDPNQNLNGAYSIYNYLTTSFYKQGIQATIINLPRTYRCPENIANFATGVLITKDQIMEHSDKLEADKIEAAVCSDDKGEVQYLEKLDPAALKELKQMAQRHDFAVITSAKYIDAVKELLASPSVFEPEQIKGLEFPVIFVYRLIEGDDFILASKGLTSGKHIDKRDLRPAFNTLFTVFTRAQERLIVYQPQMHKLSELHKTLKTFLPQENTKDENVSPAAVASTPMEWAGLFLQYLQNDNIEQAQAVFRRFIVPSEQRYTMPVHIDEWVALYQKLLDKRHLAQAEAVFHIYITLDMEAKQYEELSAASSDEAIAEIIHDKVTEEQTKQEVAANNSPIKPLFHKRIQVKNTAAKASHNPPPLTTYETGLLKNLNRNCNHKNLSKIFSSDKLVGLLFEKNPLYKNSIKSMIFDILSEEYKRDQLYTFLETNPDSCKKITGNMLNQACLSGSSLNISYLFYLSLYQDCELHKFLKLLLINAPAILDTLNVGLLFEVKEINNKPTAVFWNLTPTKEGAECLRLFLNLPNFLKQLTSEDLHRIYSVRIFGTYEYRLSAFKNLVTFLEEDDSFIYELLERKPELLNDISGDILFNILPSLGHSKALATPFYEFSKTQRGISLLIRIFQNNEQLVHFPRAVSIFKFQVDDKGMSPSAFFYLASCKKGIEFLTLLMEQNNNFVRYISKDEFFRCYFAYPFNDLNSEKPTIASSVFDLLCKRKEGSKLLEKILILRPDILSMLDFKYLLASDFNFAESEVIGEADNFYYLLGNYNIPVLKIILEKYPEFAHQLTAAYFDREIRIYINDRYMDVFLRELINRDIFKPVKCLLKEINPDLFPSDNASYSPRLFSNSDRAQEASTADGDAAEIVSHNGDRPPCG